MKQQIFVLLSVCLALSNAKVIPLSGDLSPAIDQVSCNYVMMGSQYTCAVIINNPGGADNFTSIDGEHLDGRSDDDVTLIYGMSQISRNIPRVFCQTFPNILDFIFEDSRVEILTEEAFVDCRNIEFIILGYNLIRQIPNRVFATNEHLEYVFLHRNLIQTIANDAFAGTNRIAMLDLAENQLTTYNQAWFRPIQNTLTHLYLNSNRFVILPFFAFGELAQLVELDIANNDFISIPGTSFYGLMRLERLSMQGCNIRTVESMWFSTLLNLTTVIMSNNNIRDLPANTFNNQLLLTDVNLSGNDLTFINRDVFGASLTSLLFLTATNNRLQAIDERLIDDGDLLWLQLRDNECIDNNFYDVRNEGELVRSELSGCFVNFIGSISCQYIQNGPDSYECLMAINNPVGGDFDDIEGDHLAERSNEDVIDVQAIMQNTRNIPSVICRTFPNTEDLSIEVSNVEFIDESSFEHCANLWRVNLNVNSIASVPDNTFRNNPNLEVFLAIVNQISHIGNTAFAGTQLRDINLEDNVIANFNPAVFNTVSGTLRELNLAYNVITSLPPQAFVQLINLESLTLSDNHLATIPLNAFQGLISLTHLELENCGINNVEAIWFNDLWTLTDLRLDGNNIARLPEGVFNRLENLLTISIGGNRIRNLNANAFGNSLQSLVLLYANGNDIRAIDDEIITRGSRIATIQLNNNNCVSEMFFNVQNNLEVVRTALAECFRMFAGFIECSYVRVRNDYICHLAIQNVQPRNDFFYIAGEHMIDMTNNDVNVLDAMRQETLIVPSILCRQFPNLQDLYIDESFLEVINEDSFEDCRNLQWLDLYGNALTSVPDFTFANSPNLAFIYLLHNQISHVAPNAFAGTSLTMLDFDHNQLSEIDPRWLQQTTNLQYLYLTFNVLRDIPEDAFDGLTRLELIGLGVNQLTTLPSRLFHPLSSLRYIYLHQNQLTEVDPQWFESLQALEFVTFYRNQIADIPAHTFVNNVNLHEVDFGFNRLRLLHADSFSPTFTNVSYVMVDYNEIDFIDPEFFDGLLNINFLYLNGNVCVNRNFYGVQTSRNASRDALDHCFENFNRVNPINCIYVSFTDYQYTCYMTVNNLPGNDNAEVILGDHVDGNGDEDVAVVFMNNQITRTIPSVICRQFPSLVELWTDMSEIQTINERTFADCQNLQTLVFEYNPIHIIPGGAFVHNANLEIIWLDFNHIHRIEGGAFSGTAIRSLGLGVNDLQEFNRNMFDGIRSTLADIFLYENKFTTIPSDGFTGLDQLRLLDIGINEHLVIPSDIFSSLANPSVMEELYLDNIGIREVHPQWFTHLSNLRTLHLHRNNVRSLANDTFAALTNVENLFIGGEDLRFLGLEAFGDRSLSSLTWLNVMSSNLFAIDEEIFDRAENLQFLYLYDNHCTSMNFYQVHLNREAVREDLAQCFESFVGTMRCQYIVITGYPYMCELYINNVAGRDNFDSIPGDHIGSQTNEDVRLLEALGQRTRNLPSTLCATFINTEEIYITNSEIEVITTTTFEGCTQLDRLTLAYNNILVLPSDIFRQNANLGWLSLYVNQISEIGDNAFTGSRLDVIELSLNQLTSFNPEPFAAIGSTLEVLDLNTNRIAELPSNAFAALPVLKDLDLSRNPGLIIPSNAFENQVELHDLVLNEIGLRHIDAEWFRNTSSLTYVSLSSNNIRRIPDAAFAPLTILRTIVLRSNNIDSISVYHFGFENRNLTDLIADYNRVNAFDIQLFDQMEELRNLYLRGNACSDQNFANVQNNRENVRNSLMTCFENYGIDEPDRG